MYVNIAKNLNHDKRQIRHVSRVSVQKFDGYFRVTVYTNDTHKIRPINFTVGQTGNEFWKLKQLIIKEGDRFSLNNNIYKIIE